MPKTGRDAPPRIWNPQDLGLQGWLLFGESQFAKDEAATPRHSHSSLEIGFCLRASLVLETENASLPIRPGDFFVNQPGTLHHITTKPNGMHIYWTLLDVAPGKNLLGLPIGEREAFVRKTEVLPPVIPAAARARTIRSILAEIALAFSRKITTSESALAARVAFLSLIRELFSVAEKTTNTEISGRIRAIAAEMRANPGKSFRIDDLAWKACLSPAHFITHFRQATGNPPIRYLLQCRIDKAKELILAGEPAVKIARMLGFASPQHFSETFSRIAGLSPRAYRKQGGASLGLATAHTPLVLRTTSFQ